MKGNPLTSIDPDGMQAIPLLPPPPVVTGAPGAVGAYNGGDLSNPNGNWDFGPKINLDSLKNVLMLQEMMGIGPNGWLNPNSATSQMSLAVIKQACSTDEGDEDDHCDKRYAEETAVCRAIKNRRSSKAAARCYASAAQRYAACLRGEHVPVFDVWNN